MVESAVSNPMHGIPWPVLLLTLLHSAVSLALWFVILVMGIARWEGIKLRARGALVLMLLVLVLSLPGLVASFLFLDLGAALPAAVAGIQQYLAAAVMVFSVVMLLVGTAHGVLQVGLSELATDGAGAFPLLFGKADARRGWMLAVVFGLVAAVVSVFVFRLAGIKAGFALDVLKRLYPQLMSGPRAFLVLVFGPTALAAAISEEILYRGVVQGWLLRWWGRSRLTVFLSIALASTFWAVGHAANTTPMLPKLAQVILLGLTFGWLARRYSVEASIVAHAVLNATAVALSFALGW